ncbi:putative cation/H+ exchanger, cation/H+ exchanger, CPA1 family, na+/H+ exchanger NHX -type [Lupinus albus]|uniref:Sodium/hydrogen exchanger n=1 Tax=Lupinus albus TaxID=3870 RepID=A0A6A4QRU7_LUPAL|nr:putative cation/H+ exchanger, cation/H+ exchanger, CPA1 family, na+/H+ exchanger NHX -type [Lupinus albus]
MSFEISNVLSKMKMLYMSDHGSVVSMNIFVALLCACIVLGHLLEEYRWINESITALSIGLCTGVIILMFSGGKSSHLLVFSEDLFFIYLLPPIIFNAGFQVKKKQFFVNFITIVMFGAVGTLICWTIITFGAIQIFKRMGIHSLELEDYLAIGAIFAATDSVCTLQVLNQDETPLLYSLVFGEGVVNDATSVVLFNAIKSFDLNHIDPTVALQFLGNFLYLFIASTMLGVLTGLLSAYIIKKLYIGRHSTDREVSLMMLMAYLSYMLAELCYLSGILTVFFCGIVMSHYTWHNVTESSRTTTKHSFATLSFVAETFIFLYVGMDALDIEKWRFVSDSPGTSIAVSSVLLGLILTGRAAFIFPLSFLSNLTKKSPNEKISFRQQVIIWWAGLMRGAVSIALAYNQFTMSGYTQQRSSAIMITSTITVVLFSTVVFGMMTKPLIRFLVPHSKRKNSMQNINDQVSSSPTTSSMNVPLLENSLYSEADIDELQRPSSLRDLLSTPTHTVHCLWRKFDNGFMRPVFGGRGFVPIAPISPTQTNNLF